MIVAIYGIPRSGKDTFINEIIKRKTNSYHLKGSENLNRIANKFYNCSFKELGTEKQIIIREEFIKYAKSIEKNYDFIIVDGHYSFPVEGQYKTVFTDYDLNLYDAFFYLNRNPDEIIRNYESGEKKEYKEYLLSAESIFKWEEFEISEMKDRVEAIDKDFIILDSDSLATDFVCEYKNTSKSIAISIANSIKEEASNKRIILTDLDKTLSINDLTDDFMINSGLNLKKPKSIFKGDFYTSYQFYSFHKFLLSSKNYDESIQYAVDRIRLNQELIDDLNNYRNGCYVVGITTGILDAWNKLNEKNNLFNCAFGKNNTYDTIITPLIKKLIAKYLAKDSDVMAIGDSIIDIGMLMEAKKGYLISMNKLDKRIIDIYEKKGLKSNIYQLSYSNYKYDFLKEDSLKW